MPKTCEVKCNGEVVIRNYRDLNATEKRERFLDAAMMMRDYPEATGRKIITNHVSARPILKRRKIFVCYILEVQYARTLRDAIVRREIQRVADENAPKDLQKKHLF